MKETMGAFVGGVLAGIVLFSVVLAACRLTPADIEARWCAELFAVPQADTLAILRDHNFCSYPHGKRP